jgi:hypothetical protein
MVPGAEGKNEMIKQLFFGAALAALTIGGVAHAADTPVQADANEEVAMPAAQWLFVQVGNSFTTDGMTLTIKGVAPQTLMFADRPERMTGDALTSKFVANWDQGKDDFQQSPPNATISTVVDGKTVLAVVELLNPKLSGDSITYDIRPLDGSLPSAGDKVSLFIDYWYGPGWRGRWGYGWGHGPGPWGGGSCWRGPWGHLHCRPWWG